MTHQEQEEKQRSVGEEFIEKLSSIQNEPSWLRQFRIDALKQYEDLPEEMSNLYSKYALRPKLSYEILSETSTAMQSEPSALIRELADGIESTGYYYVSSQTETLASKSVRNLESRGIIFCDLHEALEKHADLLRRIFDNKAILPKQDKFAAFNSAFFSSGWLVYIPKEVRLESPLRIRSYLNTTAPLISQIWVYADRDSSASVQTESYGDESENVASEVVEVYLNDATTLSFSNIQNYSNLTTVISNKKAMCGRDSTIKWTIGYFGGKATRARMESVFLKDGASAEDVEVAFGNASQKFDLVSDLSHLGRNTRGRILANCVLKDKSTSVFKGMIRIGKEAKNANAYLAGHSILLGPDASSDSIPGLEILTNDVKATHSSSVAQIDEDQIFYMMTRGLSQDEAKKFIVLGFLEPGISRIDSEELRELMRDLVEAKWYGIKGLLKKEKKEVLFEEEDQSSKAPKDIFEGHYKYR